MTLYNVSYDLEIGAGAISDFIKSNSATRQEREDLGVASNKSYLSLTSTAEIDTCFSH